MLFQKNRLFHHSPKCLEILIVQVPRNTNLCIAKRVLTMEQFDELMVRYDGLIRKVLAHMRIYENFEEFYHIVTIELWLATITYCAKKSGFEKYAF